jgi:hypothetical protein
MTISTTRLVELLSDELAKAVKLLKDRLDSRSAQVEARVTELEKRLGIEPRNVAAVNHKAGDVVEFGGAQWLCRGAGRYRRVEVQSS